MCIYLRKHPEGLTFKVRVLPRAKKNQVVGLVGDALKIRLTAPPVDGAANTMCLRFLAGLLGLPRSALAIVRGRTGREKMIRITGLPQKEIDSVIARLKALIS